MKLHRDCHINFDNAYYSAPFRLVGQRLRVQGGSQVVRIYTQDYELVATHDRAGQAGARSTHPDHLPPEKLDGLYGDRASCQAVAQDIGPAAAEVVDALLADPIVDRLGDGAPAAQAAPEVQRPTPGSRLPPRPALWRPELHDGQTHPGERPGAAAAASAAGHTGAGARLHP